MAHETKRLKIFICLAVWVCFSCQDEGYMVNRLDSITAETDTNPQHAIEKIGSLGIDTRLSSDKTDDRNGCILNFLIGVGIDAQ